MSPLTAKDFISFILIIIASKERDYIVSLTKKKTKKKNKKQKNKKNKKNISVGIISNSLARPAFMIFIFLETII